jgi:hypothetical protein
MDKRKSLGILAIAAAAMLLISAVAADGSALACKSGGYRGKCISGTTTSATLSVAPNPVPLNSTTITISGSGFGANQMLVINAWFIPQPSVTTDGNGAFSFDYSPSGGFWLAGPSSVQALNPSTLAVLATALYTVQ